MSVCSKIYQGRALQHPCWKFLCLKFRVDAPLFRILPVLLLFFLLLGIKPAFCYPKGSSLGFLQAHKPPPQNIEPVLSKLEEHINRYIQSRQIPGCAIAVVHHNEVVYMRGFGVKTLGTKDKIDADTIFQLGSVSKPVAATLAAILENQGLLKFDDPVSQYIPNFSLNSKQSHHQLKIRHILSHSSGIPRGGFNNLIEAHSTFPEIISALKRAKVVSSFGRRYDYHNAVYSLISEVTQCACGNSFNHALKTKLLLPLNMTHTSSTLDGLLATDNRASPHTKTRKGLIPCATYSKGYYTVAPAGGINSNVRDMAIFLKAHMGGYPHVVNHRMLAKLHTPQVPTKLLLRSNDGPADLIKNARYALGWRVVDFSQHRLIYHGGWLKGFTNFVGFIPDHELGIIILHNGDSKFSTSTAVKFFEMYLNVPKRKLAKADSGDESSKAGSKAKGKNKGKGKNKAKGKFSGKGNGKNNSKVFTTKIPKIKSVQLKTEPTTSQFYIRKSKAAVTTLKKKPKLAPIVKKTAASANNGNASKLIKTPKKTIAVNTKKNIKTKK